MENVTETNLENNINNVAEMQNNILRKKHRKTKYALLIIFVFSLILVFTRPTLVIDSKTLLPVSGANVKYKSSGWNGCRDKSESKTILGVAFYLGLFSPCQLNVSKEGYHINGANKFKTLPGFLGLRIVKLNEIDNPQEFVVFNRHFTSKKPSMNIATYLYNLNPNLDPINFKDEEEDYDFIFSEIGNEAKDKNTIGPAILKIEFSGDGGVQAISADDIGHSAVSQYFDLENLLEAPVDGYQKSLFIESGKSYVARLKDGAHYMKFHVFSSKNIERDEEGKEIGVSYACMTGYIQPEKTTNLNFVGVYDNIFCSEDSNPKDSAYDLKNKYVVFKKELTGKHIIESTTWYRNRFDTLYLKDYMGKYYFDLAPNNNRFSDTYGPISIKALDRLEVEVKLPPFEIFNSNHDPSSTKIPIDIFINGKYVDRSQIFSDQ